MRFVLVALILTACTTTRPPTVWYKDGGNADQFAHDQLECSRFALEQTQAELPGNLFYRAEHAGPYADQCLRSLGYYAK